MSTYNMKIYTYKYGAQVRFYQKPIEKKGKEEKYIEGKHGQLEFKLKKKREFSNTDETKDREEAIRRSQNRSKNMIYQIARSNEWNWYCTFTLNPNRVKDRYDYDECSKAFLSWLQNMKRSRAPDLKYLFVPEQHKDGAWHFHGLLSDTGDLLFLDSGHTYKNYEGEDKAIYNLIEYTLGYSDISKVEKPEQISAYITKYITKGLCELTFNKKRYWASRNLEKPIIEEYNIPEEEKDLLIAENKEDIKDIRTKKFHRANNITYIEL